MDEKTIKTNDIGFVAPLEGCSNWYWGTDCASGDLYEAQELWEGGHPLNKNRLILVSYPQGELFEPLIAEEGQYFGAPVYMDGSIFCLLVDFERSAIRIYRILEKWITGAQTEEKADAREKPTLLDPILAAELPLDSVKDCYNLQLAASPLCLVRQGHDNDFQVIWPEHGDFSIAPSESFYFRGGDELIFSKWYEEEEPYYRYWEDVVVRSYPDGKIKEQRKGSLLKMPNGDIWGLA